MNLYIMSRGRSTKQTTLHNIPLEWQKRTYVVHNNDESEQYSHIPQAIPAPTWVQNYSDKMQYLIDRIELHDGGIGVIMDDDLWFNKRIEGQEKLRKPENASESSEIWQQMEQLLQNTALVGIHPRQMGHNKKLPYVENGKIICVQGINTHLFPGDFERVNHYPILSDVWLNCQLLSRGVGNKLITTWVQDHGSCQAPGGCSIYRTPDMQRECCEALETKFSPHFKTVIKEPKSAKWMGGKRYDFRVQWKRMYEEGRSKRNL
jgi:hypothetical protein